MLRTAGSVGKSKCTDRRMNSLLVLVFFVGFVDTKKNNKVHFSFTENKLEFVLSVDSEGYSSVSFDTFVSVFADDGWLHRAVDIEGEMHIIEELQLFDKPQPVESMVISSALVCIPQCIAIHVFPGALLGL